MHVGVSFREYPFYGDFEVKPKWLWVQNRCPKWIPGKWNQGLQPAVSWWLSFDPYPNDNHNFGGCPQQKHTHMHKSIRTPMRQQGTLNNRHTHWPHECAFSSRSPFGWFSREAKRKPASPNPVNVAIARSNPVSSLAGRLLEGQLPLQLHWVGESCHSCWVSKLLGSLCVLRRKPTSPFGEQEVGNLFELATVLLLAHDF